MQLKQLVLKHYTYCS